MPVSGPTAAYLYVLSLDAPARAWEYLRRNAGYLQDWTKYGLINSRNAPARPPRPPPPRGVGFSGTPGGGCADGGAGLAA